ncbi:hypothetical protein Mpal_0382 [Methanosphaerula palustris E1-9c]|uniref:Uncharacterized protein n=1 Tax=Methanosphaerula palustris (strain ATCC BAA-1556 / DSM 19958 / E1-9c) TaxID=521011 RepID=B8GJV3_METPE|nr:hypothetical protein Mpal_0382 [Methanosphaerula palustris E1-9c]
MPVAMSMEAWSARIIAWQAIHRPDIGLLCTLRKRYSLITPPCSECLITCLDLGEDLHDQSGPGTAFVIEEVKRVFHILICNEEAGLAIETLSFWFSYTPDVDNNDSCGQICIYDSR